MSAFFSWLVEYVKSKFFISKWRCTTNLFAWNIIFSPRSQTTHLRVASASCSSLYAKSGTLQDFVCGFWKILFMVPGKWEFLDQSKITSKVLSFLQFSIAMGQWDIIKINNKQTQQAFLVINMLTACCDIGQSLPDLADVHRQIHFSSAETQLPKKHVETR